MHVPANSSTSHANREVHRGLSEGAEPPADAAAAAYVAWRALSLRWVCLAIVLYLALGYVESNALPSVKLKAGDPSSIRSRLETGLTWYLRSLTLSGFVLVFASAWFWRRPNLSRVLLRAAWIIGFLGALPLYLIPLPKVLGLRGIAAAHLALDVIRSMLISYIPTLFAFLPALIRSAVVLKRFLPDSVLPGILILVSTPLCSLIYLLVVSIFMQVLPHWDLIGGFLFLALAPLIYLTRTRALMRPTGTVQEQRSLRLIARTSTGCTLVGCVLILYSISRAIDLMSIIGQELDLWWAFQFLAGILANRAMLTVMLVDGVLELLAQAHTAEDGKMQQPES